MANTDVNVKLTVSDGGGTAKLNKEAAQYRSNMEAGASALSKASSGPRMSAAYRSTENAMGRGETKTSRSIGAGAGTGSAASDFAAQASGLGGLVHVYATFAANIFAVSAAFAALSKAMDTANLVKGLDQLGVASGRNLGTLAKQMVSVTNGALSMRESLTSVALASSGGMSNKEILRMTEVAKQASQVLGRDLSDSMDRLTKGIVKNQPELLDELGIMTRMIPAQQAYARSIGKSVDSLTDLEKKQAFTNAVLKEGEEKFGKIAAAGNPYNALLAGTKDALQFGLELVNKVLGPIAGFLASSPTALTASIGVLTAILMKQAVPALGQLRENSKKLAEESHQRVLKIAADSEERFRKEDERALKSGLAQFKAAKDTKDKIDALKLGTGAGLGKATIDRANQDPFLISDTDIKKLEAKYKELSNKGLTGKELTDAQLESYQKSAIALRKHLDEMYSIRQAAETHAADYMDARVKDSQSRADHESQLRRIMYKEQQQYSRRLILSSVAEEAATMGPVRAWKLLNEELSAARATQKGDIFDKTANGVTRLKGAFSIATSAISTAVNAFGVWGQVAGLVIGAVGLFDAWMSKAEKEASAFTSSLEATTDASRLMRDVLIDISKKDTLAWMNAESMNARANAMRGASDSIALMLSNLSKFEAAASPWEKFWDSFIGKSRQQKAAISISDTIKQTLKTSTDYEANSELQSKILSIMGGKDVSTATKEQLAEISDYYDTWTAKRLQNAKDLNAPKLAFQELDKAFQTLSNSALPTDNMSKFSMELIKTGTALFKASGDTINFANELVRLSDSIEDLAKLGDIGLSIFGDSKKIKETVLQYDTATKAINSLKEANEALSKANNTNVAGRGRPAVGTPGSSLAKASSGTSRSMYFNQNEEQRFSNNRAMVRNIETQLNAKAEIDKITSEYLGSSKTVIDRGIAQFNKSMDNALAQASLKFAASMASAIGGVSGAKLETATALQEVALRKESNNTMLQLIIAQKENTFAIEKASALRTIEELDNKKNRTAEEDKRLANAKNEIKAFEVLSTSLLKSNKDGSKEVDRKAMESAMTSSDIPTRMAAEKLGTTYYQARETQNKNNIEDQNAKVITLNGLLKEVEEKYKNISRDIQFKISMDEADLAINKQLSDILINSSFTVATNIASQNIEKQKLLAIDSEIAKLNELHSIKIQQGKQYTEAENAEYDKQLNALYQKYTLQEQSNQASALSRDIALVNKKYAEQAYIQLGKNLSIEQQYAQASGSLDNQSKLLDMQKSIGAATEEQYIAKKGLIDQAKLELDYQNSLYTIGKSKADAEREAQKVWETGVETLKKSNASDTEKYQQLLALNAQRDESNKRAVDAATSATSIAQNKLAVDSEILKVNTEYNAMLAKQNGQMQNMVGITESLTTLFGEMGTNIGKAGEALLKMAQDDEKYAAAKTIAIKEQQAAAKLGDQDGIIAAEEKLASIKKKAALDEAKNIASVASASKKMFGEKTAAYKVLDGVEKAAHAWRIATMVQENITKLQGIWASLSATLQANSIQQASDIPTALLAIVKTLGWPGVAAGAAFIASLGLSGGGSAPSVSQGSLAGTGQQVNADGSVGERVGGVVGDQTAKANSIVDSIDALNKTFFEGMINPGSSILIHLKAIQDNTYSMAKYVGASINSMNTQGFNLSGGPSDILGQLVNTIFGGSSQRLGDTGVKASGTIGSLSDKTKTNATGYTDVITDHRGFLGIGSTTSHDITNWGLGDALTPMTKMFQNLGGTVKDLGAAFGLSDTYINGFLENYTLSFDVIKKEGESSKDFADRISSEMSVQFNKAIVSLIPGIDKFTKAGEEYGTVAARLVTEGAAVNHGLDLIGSSLKGLGGTVTEVVGGIFAMFGGSYSITREMDNAELTLQKIEKQQNIINNFGGIDNFVGSIKAFYDVTRTDAQKATDSITLTSKKLAELGLPANSTAESLGVLASTLDPESDLFTAIVKLAPELDAAQKAMQKITDASNNMKVALEDIKNGSTDASISLSRIQKLRDTPKELQSDQKAIWAAEDAAKLRKKETDLMSAQGLTAQALARSREDELKTMTLAEQVIQKEIWAAQDKAKLVSMAVSLLDLEGRTYEATQAKRAKALAGMTADEASIQAQIDAQEDKNKTDSLTLKIAGLQGRSAEVLIATRNKELKALSESDQALQKQIYVLEDIASFADKAGIGVSGLTRLFMDQLNSTAAGADATEAGKYVGDMVVYGIKKTMYENALTAIMTTMYNTVISPIINGILVGTIVFDDFGNMTDIATGKVTSLSTVLETLGNDAETMADRLDKATPWLNKVVTTVANSTSTIFTNLASGFKDFVGNMPEPPKVPDTKSSQDLAKEAADRVRKGQELDIELMHAQRKEYAALSAERALELEDLRKYDAENGTAYAAKKELIYTAQDGAKTYDLTTTLLEAEGKTLEATNRKRDIERLALSETDKAIQERIWKLEDEKAALEKKNSYESQIYDLLGKKSGSLAIARKAELDAMDQQYRPMQEYIYALEDEVDLRGKISDAIYSNIDNMKGFVKSLRDYKKELMVGSLSTKTPLQKYEAAKTEFEKLLAIAKGPAKTNAEIAARDEAVGKLQGASSTFLELSQTMFASSETYQKDFSTVSSALDDTANSLETQISTDIKQLDELGLIKEATRDTKDLIADLLDLATKTETARVAAEKAGSTAAASGISNIATGKYVDEAYKTILNRTADTAGRDFWVSALKSGTSVDQMIAAIKSSPEGLIQGLYQSNLGRYADQGGLAFWMQQLSSGTSVSSIASSIGGSPEAIIKGWYNKVLGRSPESASASDYWANAISSMGLADAKSAFAYEAAKELGTTIDKLPAFKLGGDHRGGLRLVGDAGPEIEATGPSRIHSRNQLSEILGNKELINEIKALRQEVAQLRQEQQEQTGHLIQTNYDANMRAASIVADATDEAANAATWNQRNQVAIK